MSTTAGQPLCLSLPHCLSLSACLCVCLFLSLCSVSVSLSLSVYLSLALFLCVCLVGCLCVCVRSVLDRPDGPGSMEGVLGAIELHLEPGDVLLFVDCLTVSGALSG